MKAVSGLVYKNGHFIEAHAVFEGRRLDIFPGPLEGPDLEGIILPSLVNCHTHLGDAFIRVSPGATVRELVAPPDGLKHRMLAEADTDIQILAMRKALETMRLSGTATFIDFREGGLKGLSLLDRALGHERVMPFAMARPAGDYDAREMDVLLSRANGIGLSAVSDRPGSELELIASHVREKGRALAFHASEAEREDINRILSLDPDFLIHMIMADDHDLKACAESKVPVVVCPRANSYFGLKPPVRQMLDAGIKVCLGTDNAMLSGPNILEEMRYLRANFNVTDREIMEIVFENGGKVLNSLPGLWAAKGENPGYFVLEGPVDAPYRAVMEASMKNIRLFDSPE